MGNQICCSNPEEKKIEVKGDKNNKDNIEEVDYLNSIDKDGYPHDSEQQYRNEGNLQGETDALREVSNQQIYNQVLESPKIGNAYEVPIEEVKSPNDNNAQIKDNQNIQSPNVPVESDNPENEDVEVNSPNPEDNIDIEGENNQKNSEGKKNEQIAIEGENNEQEEDKGEEQNKEQEQKQEKDGEDHGEEQNQEQKQEQEKDGEEQGEEAEEQVEEAEEQVEEAEEQVEEAEEQGEEEDEKEEPSDKKEDGEQDPLANNNNQQEDTQIQNTNQLTYNQSGNYIGTASSQEAVDLNNLQIISSAEGNGNDDVNKYIQQDGYAMGSNVLNIDQTGIQSNVEGNIDYNQYFQQNNYGIESTSGTADFNNYYQSGTNINLNNFNYGTTSTTDNADFSQYNLGVTSQTGDVGLNQYYQQGGIETSNTTNYDYTSLGLSGGVSSSDATYSFSQNNMGLAFSFGDQQNTTNYNEYGTSQIVSNNVESSYASPTQSYSYNYNYSIPTSS